jgi:glutamyl-tRNA reductase
VTLHCFGLDYQNAPLPLLEEASVSGESLLGLLREIKDMGAVREVAGLSTCNRTEFYVVAQDASHAREVIFQRLEAQRRSGLATELHTHSYSHRNESAALHLFRVAAGVESLVVGESEILGQVRRAHESGLNAGTVGGTLNMLLSRAIGFGRRVRSETNISRGNVSVASIAHRLAREQVSGLANKTLLVIGAGETARAAARHFVDEGIGQLYVLNRTAAHSEAIAGELGGRTLPLDRLETGLEVADVVVCAVGAPHYIITPSGMADIMARRSDRPMFLVDISMPRNVDPACGTLDGVRVCALEQLEAIATENRLQRQGEVALIERMAEDEARDFQRATHSNEATAVLAALRRHVDEIRRQQIARYGTDWTPEERERIERFSDTLLRSVLHDMTMNVRSLDVNSEEGRESLDLMRKLFSIPADVFQHG